MTTRNFGGVAQCRPPLSSTVKRPKNTSDSFRTVCLEEIFNQYFAPSFSLADCC
jgi:hypothetical protein